MHRFSDILLAHLEEMEFLTRTLASAHLYYLDISQALAEPIEEAKLAMLTATLDLAIDLDHKIHHQIDKNDFVNQIIKNLNIALGHLKYFPKERKVANFLEIELEIEELLNFAQEYSLNAYQEIKEFDSEEQKLLNNRILIIKSRRTI